MSWGAVGYYRNPLAELWQERLGDASKIGEPTYRVGNLHARACDSVLPCVVRYMLPALTVLASQVSVRRAVSLCVNSVVINQGGSHASNNLTMHCRAHGMHPPRRDHMGQAESLLLSCTVRCGSCSTYFTHDSLLAAEEASTGSTAPGWHCSCRRGVLKDST